MPNEEVDFSEMLRLAQEQSVVGLVAAGIEQINTIPYETKLQFIGLASQIQQRNEAMNRFIAELVQNMQLAGITTLLVKGQGVAQCYERPLWRTSGDVDFLLSDDDYQKAKKFLVPLSSSESEYSTSKHLAMTIDSWEVELHGLLRCSLSVKINRGLDDIRKNTFYDGCVRSWTNRGVQVFLLGVENDIIYVFVHFLNHFYKGGIGLRQICDWCRLLWTYRSELDLRILEQRIKRMGLMSEWKAFGAFAVDYLGMPVEAMPLYSSDEIWKKKASRIKDFILEVGNFGHNRDMSYYSSKPYLVRKVISFNRRFGDIIKHAKIFPLDSIRFFPNIMFNGIKSDVRGE